MALEEVEPLMRAGSSRLEESVGRLKGMLEASRRGVAFTGAGISTESGIPDFRSPGGNMIKYNVLLHKD